MSHNSGRDYLNPKSMSRIAINPQKIAQKAIILHTRGPGSQPLLLTNPAMRCQFHPPGGECFESVGCVQYLNDVQHLSF